MKKTIAFIGSFFISAILFASDTLESKRLVPFLPKSDVEGFTRIAFDSMAPVDEMTSAMVQYITMPTSLNGKPEMISVSISIIDGNRYRNSINKQIAPNSKDDEVVMVKGRYKGVRNNKAANPGEKFAKVAWIVGGRFLVSVHMVGSADFSLAEKFIDCVDLKGLEAASN